MDINNAENFKVVTYDVDGIPKIYTFIANDGYVFNVQEQYDDIHYVTAFTLFKEELDKLSNYKCIERTDDMIIF